MSRQPTKLTAYTHRQVSHPLTFALLRLVGAYQFFGLGALPVDPLPYPAPFKPSTQPAAYEVDAPLEEDDYYPAATADYK